MDRPPLRYQQRGGMLALFGQPQPRDGYTGTTPPAVAEPRDPARLVTVRPHPFDLAALAAVEIKGEVQVLRIERADDHQLSILSAADRSRVIGMLTAMHQAGARADAT